MSEQMHFSEWLNLRFPRECPTSFDVEDLEMAFRAGKSVGATQPQAPQGGYEGPKKWADEEVADGNKGIRWVTTDGVKGRPTSHDLMGYLQQRGKEAYCDCLQCKAFFAPTETPEAGK